MFLTLIVWIVFKDGFAKYVLYSLPITLTIVYLIVRHGAIRLHGPGGVSFLLYVMCAATSMVANAWYGFHAVRDVAIVAGYLYLYMLWFRLPASIADFSLFTLAVGMLVEAATEGIGEEINLFGSQGILESTLAFPIGAVLLYYLHYRQWGRAAIAAFWLFLAFKRITFLAVVMAVGFDILISKYVRAGFARGAALAVVLIISLVSLFSTQIFEYVAITLQIRETSANSISLGRYEMAKMLWSEMGANTWAKTIFGLGPGASDALLTEKTASATSNNPHNDWLKIFYDYGVLGLVVIHVVLFRTLLEHRVGLMLYIYGAALMMTDNIFIYMFYHPFVLLLVAAARHEPESRAAIGR